MNTNKKKFMQRVQNIIVDRFEWTPDRINEQFKAFTWIKNNYQKAVYLVEGGAFDCYYSQVAETMAELFETTSDRIWAYYKEDGGKMWEVYKHIFAKNLCCLAENNRVYINK